MIVLARYSVLQAVRAAIAVCIFMILTSPIVSALQLQVPTLPSALPSEGVSTPSSLSPISPNPSAATSAEDDERDRAKNNGASDTSQNASGVLSASQIEAVIQTRPELVVDLKQVMSDYLQQQGHPVQPDSISDDMLYSGISADSGLRTAITVWLRARGYVSDSDFDRSDSDSRVEDGRPGSSSDTSVLGSVNNSLIGDATGVSNTNRNDERSAVAGQSDDLQNGGISRQVDNRGLRLEKKPDRNSASATEVVHQTAPYNLQSLRDLYSQVPEQVSHVRRFGSDVFLDRGLATKQMPIDVPVGPDYVLGAGDGIIINLWGGISQSFARTVDREGKVVLPEAGTIVLAGLSLERAQTLVQGVLGQQYRDAKVAITLARMRTVRVYVVGDVQRPGAYDISSLSTPLNALYAAGGPTRVGSLRIARHYRGKELVGEADLYDFLLRGVHSSKDRLEAGDTILVPPAGRQVTVAGMVKRPAIYELKDETKLSEVINDAGGLMASAALTRITIERIAAEGHRTTLSMKLSEGSTEESSRAEIDKFTIQDGDQVTVAPILPYSESAIYVEGHVVRPGRFPYHDGIKLSDVIRSYQDLLPEPADHGEIIRLMPPDFRVEAIDFNIPDVIAGNEQIHLQPFDTIRISGRYEADAPKVQVHGEVLHPGEYALSQGMTAAQLVRIAGGFRRSALVDVADLTSYVVKDGRQVISQRGTVKIGEAVNSFDHSADVVLKPGDVLTVHQLSGWNDIGSSVTLTGEVTYSGSYGLQDGERLSSVLRRAGGFRSTAYPAGAVLIRTQVKELEDKSRNELIRQIETTSAGARLAPSLSAQDDAATLQLLVQQQKEVVARLRSQPAIGRLVIKIDADISKWENTPADIELRNGDVLTVPKRPGFVLVSGQVYNASAITFVPGKTAGWYLQRAGGSTEGGNRKEILVIRANGLVVGRRSGNWHDPSVLETKLDPGDVVVVPQKVFGGSALWRNLFASAQVFSSVGFAAALALH